MDFIFKVDPIRRSIKVPDAFTVLTMDHNIHKLVFVCPYYEDFAFDSASIVFMVDAPDGKQYSIPAEEYESFPNSPSPYVKFTLTLKSYITSVVGYMSFCITADIISSGNVIEKSWHTKNITISVGGHIDNDDSEDIPEEDVPTINQRLNNLDSKVGRLQTTVNGMANGSPTPVATVAKMTDESAVYLYTGSETGYTAGNWYYYDGSAWTSGGVYGGATTSTTFTEHGVPADDFAVGEALAEKADAKKTGDEITNLKSTLSDTNSALFQKSFISNYIAIPTNWQTGQGINPIDGSNLLNNKYCRTGYVPLDYPAIYIELIDSTYEFVVWGYSSTSVNNATYAPKSAYSLDGAILLKKNNSLYFRIGARRKDFADLQSSDITAIAASLKTYSIAYESKSVKKVACFGDSIMWGRDGNGSSSSRVTYTLPKILSEKCGITFDNYGVGGMGYLRPDDADNKIAYDKISETDLSTYDAVLICFGVNDGTYPIGDYDSDDLTTVMGQFNRIINYIYTHYQNKLVFVIAPFNGKNVGTFPDYWYGTHLASNRYSRLILSNSIKRVCEDYSIPYIEQFDSPINAFTIADALPDGVHPSSAYYTKIGHWLAGKLCTLIG